VRKGFLITGNPKPMTESEKWKELCAKAAAENDPQRLLELVEEINRILEEQENRKKNRPGGGTQ
jgi:hypothetical protein